ncbi:cytochrome P450 [Bombardia bombarda]|uniref:Cytochrome P450 n=1 Tax=Bombardia bombarda TaxID=252184 RepID=A0AA39XBS2_9PEZI|nr:cytochrome P450 [Bombardia bombarda]
MDLEPPILSSRQGFYSPFGVLSVLFVAITTYFALDTLSTRKIVRQKLRHVPLGGPAFPGPKSILNLIFAWKAKSLLQDSYTKFKTRAFQLIRSDGGVVVLPLSLLEELATIPAATASPQGALEHDLLGRYTGLDLIIENRLHHAIVQRKLTPRIPLLIPTMEKGVATAFDAFLPQSEDWMEFQPYQVLGRISARVAAEPIVGPIFSDNPVWLDVAFDYTENLFKTIVVLRSLPNWMQPLVYPLLPSYWNGKKNLNMAKQLLGPQIHEYIQKSNAGEWEPKDNKAEDLNILSWLSAMAKGRDRSPDVIAHVLVLVALASVHTTLLRMVNVLYDITAAGPALRDELLAEITATGGEDGAGWAKTKTKNPYGELHRLDSVLRESQRISPPTTLGMKRLFNEDYTFADGTHIPKGTYVCLPIHAIENDAAHTPDPERFDGLRSFRARQEEEKLLAGTGSRAANAVDEFLFSTPTRTGLNFGYGKTACPGRFFASVVIKMVLVKMLTEYEFKFMPGTGRPENYMVHEFLFTLPWQKMMVRRRSDGVALF